MSYKAARFPIAVRSKQSLEESLFEEGYEYVEGQLNDLFYEPGQLTQELADEIALRWRGCKIDDDAFDALINHLSKGAKYIAQRIRFGAEPNLRKLASDWAATKDLRRWIAGKDEAWVQRLDVSVPKLMDIGIRFAWQADRFCALYEQVMVADRPWGSCFQVDQGKVSAIALTPNYNRLPMWVKKVLVKSSWRPQIPSAWRFSHSTTRRVLLKVTPSWWGCQDDRPGDIWRLIDCAKAWKHAPSLPKGIAEKVGRMSLKVRILASWAWASIDARNSLHGRDLNDLRKERWERINRAEMIQSFWIELRRLCSLSLSGLIKEKCKEARNRMERRVSLQNHNKLRDLAELELELPYGYLFEGWGSLRDSSEEKYFEVIATHGNPIDACLHLFGCKGKATLKAFQSSKSDNRKWATALAFGNPDAVQKILSMPSLIGYQPEAIEFLKSLPLHSAIRMLGATEFKYRGKVQTISADHVRDTGYLWSNIQQKPELGRVRCWFSVHEQLAAAFVKELPDEALPIPHVWERVDGLCSVDGSWEIEIPKRVATLKYYGKILANCVGGYGPAIKSGRSVIFVIREYGQITHCVEVCGRSINQFYQSNNQSADWELQQSVERALEQAGLID